MSNMHILRFAHCEHIGGVLSNTILHTKENDKDNREKAPCSFISR